MPFPDEVLPSPGRPVPFGRYELLEMVGEGAMAQVFRARPLPPPGVAPPPLAPPEVAIKRLRQHSKVKDRRDLEALVNEAQLGGRLRHPNIVQVLGCDVYDGSFFLAMEFVRGWTLDEVLFRVAESGESLPPDVVVDILRQLAAGLAHAHAATDDGGRPLSLVHRDLKPHNLFVDLQGVVKITDFGLARSRSNLYRTTEADVTKGSPLYMSPEQIGGDTLDHRSDLFAVGTIAIELVTGLRAFEGDSIPNTLLRVLHVDCAEAWEAFTETTPELVPVVDRLLQRDPDDRFPHAGELLRDLDRLAGLQPPGRHTRALAAALLGHDVPGLELDLRRRYEPLGQSLVLRGLRRSDVPSSVTPPPVAAAPPAALQPPPRPSPHPPAAAAWLPPAQAVRPAPPPAARPSAPPGAARGEQGEEEETEALSREGAGGLPTWAMPVVLGVTGGVLLLLGLTRILGPGAEELADGEVAGADSVAVEPPLDAFEAAAGRAPGVDVDAPFAAPPPAAPSAEDRAVIHVPVASARLGQDLAVRVIVADKSPRELLCRYRGVAADGAPGAWRAVALAEQGEGRYGVGIPVGEEMAGGLDYWLEVRNPADASTSWKGSAGAPFRVLVR